MDIRESEIVQLKHADMEVEGLAVDEFYAKLLEVKVDGWPAFPTLCKLALGRCTIYNSSSEAERDFSNLNHIFNDRKKSSIEQLMLQSKLNVMTQAGIAAEKCINCKEKRQQHEENQRSVVYFCFK